MALRQGHRRRGNRANQLAALLALTLAGALAAPVAGSIPADAAEVVEIEDAHDADEGVVGTEQVAATACNPGRCTLARADSAVRTPRLTTSSPRGPPTR